MSESSAFEKSLKSKISKFCARRERSSSEVLKKLKDWGASESLAGSILNELLRLNFVNETRFAKAYVLDKFRFNKWGKVKIAYGLRAQNIDQSLIDLALAEIPQDEYRELIVKLLRYKWSSLKNDDKLLKKQKVLNYMLQKGYEFGSIQNELEDIMSSKEQ